ncbi:uncharacterized protein LOC108675581 [Hyalella azteca]|uniref:Copper transport protein n=1 Tax=Hyalella azteca TaxID=294128 RepID=A0A8B7NZ92_HYAAZ|nr:uncharacterized protein LOC108675581 [Hyalella azteca]
MNYFYFGYTFHNFILEGVDIISIAGFLSVVVGVSLMCIGNEGLRVARAYLAQLTPRQNASLSPEPRTRHAGASPSTALQRILIDKDKKKLTCCTSRPLHLMLQSLVHMLHISIGYVLMLVVMTFNVYFLLAVVVGVGAGYFLFGAFSVMLMARANPYFVEHNHGRLGTLEGSNAVCSVSGSCVTDQVSAAGENDLSRLCGRARANELVEGESDHNNGTPDRDRLLLMVNAEETSSEQHRTSDIVALLSGEVTVDVHV